MLTLLSVYDPTVTEWDLYYWFVEERPYPEDLIKDSELTASYAHEEIPGVREMMEMIIEHSKNKNRDIIVQPKFNEELHAEFGAAFDVEFGTPSKVGADFSASN